MMWIAFLIYGIAFGILSSIAAKKKNRDEMGWFFVGFFFGVFGLIAAIIVEEVHSEDTLATIAAHTFDPSALTKTCPACAETIKLEARVCRFCQHQFSEEQVAQQLKAARDEFDGNARLMERLH